MRWQVSSRSRASSTRLIPVEHPGLKKMEALRLHDLLFFHFDKQHM